MISRPHKPGDESVNVPVEQAIIPNRILDDSETKTSLARAYREYGAHMDWVLKVTLWVEFLLYARPLQADHDTYIVMENLREFLGDFNSSQALFAGSLYICRLSAGIHHLKNITYAFVRSEVADCKEDGIEDKNEVLQIYIKHRFIFPSPDLHDWRCRLCVE